MKMSLNRLREQVANRLLDLRNLEYLVRTDDFEALFERANDDLRQSIFTLCDGASSIDPSIRYECATVLKEMVRTEAQRDVSMKDLRKDAQKLNVPRYSRMSKSELLSEIAVRKERNGKQQPHCQPDCGAVH